MSASQTETVRVDQLPQICIEKTQVRTCFVMELDDNADGAEDLFLDDLHIRLRVREDRRLNEVALVAKALATES
jgi:hypothetical protein